MRVLVTGANGFIGSNLCVALARYPEVEILRYDISTIADQNHMQQLFAAVLASDFIIHLAGANRPQSVEEFKTTNSDLTAAITRCLQESNKNTGILLASSTQAALDNPYGITKRQAERIIFDYARNTGAQAFIYRLPNVFGKWSRPNYNSVVATWCYQIARGMDIRIDAPEATITLAYIDDVVSEFCSVLLRHFEAMKKTKQVVEPTPETKQAQKLCEMSRTFTLTLQALADRIKALNASRYNLIMPDLSDDLNHKLYAQFFAQLDVQDFATTLDTKTDARGCLAELIKSKHFGQIFVSKTKPGITRGGHGHDSKAEKFIVIQGKAKIVLKHMVTGEKEEFTVEGDSMQSVDIAPGYAHSIENIGDTEMITLFYANELFHPERSDTYPYAMDSIN